eukprot:3139725-Rhodomonas_salina.1
MERGGAAELSGKVRCASRCCCTQHRAGLLCTCAGPARVRVGGCCGGGADVRTCSLSPSHVRLRALFRPR